MENNENLLRNREIEYYRKEIKHYEEKLVEYEKQVKVSEIFKGFLAYFLGSILITGFIGQLLSGIGILEDPPIILVWFFILVIFFTLYKIANPVWIRSHYIDLIKDTENRIRDLYRKIRELES